MGKKIEATELIEVKVDFVSFVDEGANGQEFQIFKSADYKPKEKKTESITMNAEEANFLVKFIGFFKRFARENKEENMDLDKILDAIKGVTESVKAIDGRITSIEEKMKKDGGDPDEKTEEKPEKTDGPDTGDTEAKVDPDATEGDTPDVEKGEDGKDKTTKSTETTDKTEDNKESEVEKALEAVASSIEKINDRLASVEKVRMPSKAVDGDPTKPVEKSVFAGIF